ncbi:hypothetical protein GCM10009347_42920 [Shewanella algicola]|nr:hypothetical protein GCM10009347_42920 [Shewanella algicola]
MNKFIANILNAVLFDNLVIVIHCLDDFCKHTVASNIFEVETVTNFV